MFFSFCISSVLKGEAPECENFTKVKAKLHTLKNRFALRTRSSLGS